MQGGTIWKLEIAINYSSFAFFFLAGDDNDRRWSTAMIAGGWRQ
jgi:hypothetical protein